jgi:hypothetical protein
MDDISKRFGQTIHQGIMTEIHEFIAFSLDILSQKVKGVKRLVYWMEIGDANYWCAIMQTTKKQSLEYNDGSMGDQSTGIQSHFKLDGGSFLSDNSEKDWPRLCNVNRLRKLYRIFQGLS